MGDHDDLTRVVRDPVIYRRAVRRAGTPELAEDALQEVGSNLAKKDLGAIDDVRAYFIRALFREISHLRVRNPEIPVEDITAASEQRTAATGHIPQDCVEHEAEIRRLARIILTQLNADSGQLAATVPARSADPQQYRAAIIAATRAIFLMLLQSTVASADWNAALKSSNSWFAEAGLTPDVIYQRLSRGRYDVRALLQRLLPREELG
jgi:hypothetical protein